MSIKGVRRTILSAASGVPTLQAAFRQWLTRPAQTQH
jgi:hypothetical protein